MLYFKPLVRWHLSLSPPGQHGLPLLTPGYLMFFVNIGPRLRAAEEEMAKIKTSLRTWVCINRFLSSFSAEVHIAKSSHFHNRSTMLQICVISSEHLILSSVPLHHPPTTSITADDFASFLQTKLKQSVVSFHLHSHRTPNQLDPLLKTPIFSFCPLTEAEVSKLLLSSHPTTCPLDPIPSHLLQAISPTLLPALTHSSTHLSSQASPHCILSRLGYPTAQKPTLTILFRKLQTCLSPSIHCQTHSNELSSTRSHCFFHRTTNWTLNSQFQEWPFNWDCATLGHWSPANCKSRFQIISPHSAGTVCRCWHCQSSDPPVHPLITGYHWDSTSLVWILSHWSVFQGGLGRGGIQST